MGTLSLVIRDSQLHGFKLSMTDGIIPLPSYTHIPCKTPTSTSTPSRYSSLIAFGNEEDGKGMSM